MRSWTVRAKARASGGAIVAILPSVEPAITENRAQDDPDQTTAAQSPRLWCPGLVFVTRQGDVRLGLSVGYSSGDSSFRPLDCGYRSEIAYWTHTAWLVSRRALNPRVVAEHAIILPEALIDRDVQPHAHRWIRQQPLVCVSGSTWQRLAAAAVRVFRVSFDATGDRVLEIESGDGPSGRWLLTVGLDELESATTAACRGRSLLDDQGDPSPIDRVLRLVSGDVLDESAVLNAFDVRSLIEDGYGYHGALEGHFNGMDDLARRLESVDELFGEIFDRAKKMHAVAVRLREGLANAAADAQKVSVPLYGHARAVLVPAVRAQWGDRSALSGQMEPEIFLAPERRWTVAGVDAWSPRLSTRVV